MNYFEIMKSDPNEKGCHFQYAKSLGRMLHHGLFLSSKLVETCGRALFPSPLAVNPFSHSRLDINAIRVHSPAKKEEGRNFVPHCVNVKDNFAPQAKNSRLPLLFMLSHVCTVESPCGSCVNPAQESRSPSA